MKQLLVYLSVLSALLVPQAANASEDLSVLSQPIVLDAVGESVLEQPAAPKGPLTVRKAVGTVTHWVLKVPKQLLALGVMAGIVVQQDVQDFEDTVVGD